MVINQELSLRAQVFQYFSDHPNLASSRSNGEFYNAFAIKSEKAKNKLRTYKAQYNEQLIGFTRTQKNKVINPRNINRNIRNITKINEIQKLDRWALNKKKIEIWKLPDQDLKDLFIKFVGFRGHLDKNGYAVLDPKGEIHRGQAVPEPVDEITDYYWGIQDYQVEFIITYRDHFNILDIWGRGFGKTWVVKWIIQISMKYEADKFLYFSLTDVAFEVANDVYIWGQSNNAIVAKDTVQVLKKVSGRQASYQKFSLINGARFEVHGIRTSTTLGYHGWILIMDDIIDEQHKRLPHLQKSLERKWNSQYSKIRRKKLLMVNTRKFVGDFFDFMIDQFEKKANVFGKRKGAINLRFLLHISLKTPYRTLFYEGDIAGYREFITRFEKGRIEYDKDDIIAPWYFPEEIKAMRLENLKVFYAEMMGNPRSIEGGNWQRSDLRFVSFFEQMDYEAVIMFIDPAWTVSEHSDASGVVILGIKKELYQNRRMYTVFRAYEVKLKIKAWQERDKNGKSITHQGILDFIEEKFQWIKSQFTMGQRILVMVETNSGGQIIIDVAVAESDNYEFAGCFPEEELLKKLAYSKMDKNERIDSQLYDTIKNKDMEFLDVLDDGVLINEILLFDDLDEDHAIDALAKGKHVLHTMKRRDVARARLRAREILEDQKRWKEKLIEERFDMQGIKGIRRQSKDKRVMLR